ncbi:MAG: SRPBCC family protein [Thermomicrobiales bacterium]|nr:SRPBCC family protein [Thermomicrobiales bacterium]
MQFSQQFSVDAPVEVVWNFLCDVPAMAPCIPGASNVREVGPNAYDADVSAKIGPVTARFACRVTVLNLNEAERTGVVELTGKDTKLGGSVKATLQMALNSSMPTIVMITSDVDVLGKLGQYGHGVISRRADAMLDDFASCVQAQLAPGA